MRFAMRERTVPLELNCNTAEAALAWAGQQNPGNWIGHSRFVALACKNIAAKCNNMDADQAYCFGLLHDIGRYAGVSSERHLIDGYRFCMERGWKKAGQICISHAFMIQDIHTSIGTFDVSKEDFRFMEKFIQTAVYDDYDRLVQLCDALALPTGFCLLEKRFVDVTLRYGVHPATIDRWKKTLELKNLFEKRIGGSVYTLLPGVLFFAGGNRMIKIAFFDVDGTLLKLGSKVPSFQTVQTLQQLQAKGILLCMATGRGYLSVPHFEGVDFDLWLTFNGSYVRSKDAVISKTPLDADDKRKILHNLKQMHRAAAISNEHFIVTNGTDPDLEQYFSFGNEKLVISEHFDKLCEEDIYQIMCSCSPSEYERILLGTHATQITAWWDKAVDIIPLSCGKGNAVRAVLAHYGFSKAEAIAFGDGRNDIEMLEAVGTGVAMGNALDEVKARATDCCRSVDEEGIYHYCLEKHLI